MAGEGRVAAVTVGAVAMVEGAMAEVGRVVAVTVGATVEVGKQEVRKEEAGGVVAVVEMVEACSVAAGVKVEGMKVVATVMPVVRKVGLATLEELAR